MNFVCGVPANIFFIRAGVLVHKQRYRCRLRELRCARLVAGVCEWLWGRRCGWRINKSNLCAASQDDEIRGNERALGYQVELPLFFRFDPSLTGKRLKLADQQARLHFSRNIEIRRLREGGDFRFGNENLAGLKQQRFAETIRQITSDGSFQDKHLDVELAMTLDYGRRPCARDRDRGGLDLQAASAPGYLEKHCTFAKVYRACSVAETDIRFRSETRDRLVRESQFAASGHAGVDSITVAKAFTDCDLAWRCLRRT